jgi:transposase
MPQPNDLSRSLVALDQDSTNHCRRRDEPVELAGCRCASRALSVSRAGSWSRVPKGCLACCFAGRDEAVRAGKKITRIALAFEAGRDGFWLARWLSARGVEAHVIHPSSVAVSREHRRAKTDRLDTELLKRALPEIISASCCWVRPSMMRRSRIRPATWSSIATVVDQRIVARSLSVNAMRAG